MQYLNCEFFGQVFGRIPSERKHWKKLPDRPQPLASLCPDISPFFDKDFCLRKDPRRMRFGRQARVSSVRRAEQFRQLRILPDIPGRSGPPSVCSVQSGKRAPIVCSDPMLVRSDLGDTGHSSTISRILYTMLQKKAIVFVKIITLLFTFCRLEALSLLLENFLF